MISAAYMDSTFGTAFFTLKRMYPFIYFYFLISFLGGWGGGGWLEFWTKAEKAKGLTAKPKTKIRLERT